MQWADPGVKLAHFSPVSPFGPALVPVLPRADRAVRTVSPAACTHVTCAVWMCHDTPCMSMFVKALLCRPLVPLLWVNYACATRVFEPMHKSQIVP